jgi:SAM-dependent methyltransferase
LQPGIQQILASLDSAANVLDLGCGNGELGRELASRAHQGQYIGLDLSAELLDKARKDLPAIAPITYLERDLAAPDWDKDLPLSTFDVILALAVLHHLPGAELRRQVLKRAGAHLSPTGRFIHSEWQFLRSPRLRARIQPWEKISLSEADVDPGDYLLDWRHGGLGLRYVHMFTLDELTDLARESGFTIANTFFSDGEGGQLSLYQVWMIV